MRRRNEECSMRGKHYRKKNINRKPIAFVLTLALLLGILVPVSGYAVDEKQMMPGSTVINDAETTDSAILQVSPPSIEIVSPPAMEIASLPAVEIVSPPAMEIVSPAVMFYLPRSSVTDLSSCITRSSLYAGNKLVASGESIKFGADLKIEYGIEITYSAITTEKALNLPDMPNCMKTANGNVNVEIKYYVGATQCKLGNLKVDGNSKKATFQFDQEFIDACGNNGVLDNEIIKFNLFYGCNFDEGKLGQDTFVTVNLDASTEIIVNIDGNPNIIPPIDPTITKSGIYDRTTGFIHWTVDLDPGNSSPEGLRFKDVISENHTFKDGSFKIDSAEETCTTRAAFTTEGSVSSVAIEYQFPGKLSALTSINYDTRPSDSLFYNNNNGKVHNSGTVKVTNEAFIYSSEGGAAYKESAATVDINRLLISKIGVNNPGTNEITWTLTLNTNSHNLKDIIIYDSFNTEYLTYTAVSLSTTNTAITIGAVTLGAIKDKSGLTGTGIAFEVNPVSGNLVSGPSIITYKTKILDRYFTDPNPEQSKITNKVWLDFTWVFYGNGKGEQSFVSPTVSKAPGGVSAAEIEKKAIITDLGKQEITWEITVNRNKVPLQNVVVTDIIGADQEYVTASATSTGGCKTFNITEDSNKNPIFDLGNIGNGIASFTLKTKVTDSTIFAMNATKDYYNKANLLCSSGGVTVKGSAEPKVTYKSTVLLKENTGYDYSSNETGWRITLNQNKMPMTNAAISDTFTKGVSLVEGSVTIASAGGISYSAIKGQDYNYDEGSRTLGVTVGAVIDDTYVITFKTKVDVDEPALSFVSASSVKIKNQVTLHRDVYSDQTIEALLDIKNQIVDKKGTFCGAPTKNAINYTVNINPNRATQNQRILRDTLSEKLILNEGSLKLYEATVSAVGELTASGSAIPNIFTTYTAVTTGSTLYVALPKDGEDLKKAYILTYQVFIDDLNATKNIIAKNKIELGEIGTSAGESEANSTYVVSGGGGGGWMNAYGAAMLVKKSSGDNGKLEGAVYGLYKESACTACIQSGTSDKNGEILFKGLSLNETYYIKEVTPPIGFHISDLVTTVSATTAGIAYAKNNLVTVTDDPKKGTVAFDKEASGGGVVQGATFGLYTNSAATGVPSATAVSDVKGKVEFSGLTEDTYYIKEVKAPAGYLTVDTVVSSVRNQDGTYTPISYVRGKSLSGSAIINEEDPLYVPPSPPNNSGGGGNTVIPPEPVLPLPPEVVEPPISVIPPPELPPSVIVAENGDRLEKIQVPPSQNGQDRVVSELPIPGNRQGYSFDGFYTIVNGHEVMLSQNQEITSEMMVYAKWKLNAAPPQSIRNYDSPQTGDNTPILFYLFMMTIGLTGILWCKFRSCVALKRKFKYAQNR